MYAVRGFRGLSFEPRMRSGDRSWDHCDGPPRTRSIADGEPQRNRRAQAGLVRFALVSGGALCLINELEAARNFSRHMATLLNIKPASLASEPRIAYPQPRDRRQLSMAVLRGIQSQFNQMQSGALRCTQRHSETLSGHQRHQRPSAVIRDHQGSSEVIRGHQRSSEASETISSHQQQHSHMPHVIDSPIRVHLPNPAVRVHAVRVRG